MPIINAKKTPQISFDAPEGLFGSVLHDTHPTLINNHHVTEEQVRLIFRLTVPSQPDKIFMAGRNFRPDSTSYRLFLQHWLGEDHMKEIIEGKQDIANLVGMGADLDIHQVWNPGRPKPFCSILAAHPPGSMTLTK